MGEGRCKLHGGNAGRPIIHGRYSKFLPAHIQVKVEAFKLDDNPLDLLDDLATQRALFTTYAERFQPGIPLTLADVDYLMGWSAEITRTVERIVKIRNSTALTAAEVAFIAARIPEVVAKYIHDTEQQKRFVDELLGITPATPTDIPELSAVSVATEDN